MSTPSPSDPLTVNPRQLTCAADAILKARDTQNYGMAKVLSSFTSFELDEGLRFLHRLGLSYTQTHGKKPGAHLKGGTEP